jgi:trans-2,3-dihydro-3-hydroxyanthranilate isomerase
LALNVEQSEECVMRRYRFLQLDVFTGTPFSGNQLAVVLQAEGLTDEEMQLIAKEMNFSETTFVVTASDPRALRRVRIFTPGAELPMAGHPVVGTTFALAHEGVIHDGEASPVYLQLGVGTLPVDLLFEERRLSFVWMHQPVPTFAPWPGDRGALAHTIGLDAADLDPDLPVESGSAGVPFVYVPLRSLEALGRARPGPALGALSGVEGHVGIFLFVPQAGDGGLPGARARMFAPGVGVSEDPATGSAAGPFGVYLLRQGGLKPDAQGEARLRVEQGVEMGRPSRIEVAVVGDVQAVRDVRVGGEAIVVAEGVLLLPERQ